MKQVKSLAVIPARGGSKRLPRKNIKVLHGHPLVAYTINAAKKSDLLTDFLVSSDDEEIISISQNYGAPVPFKRPASIANDEAKNNETMLHALEYMERNRGIKYDIVMVLQPTCAIRDDRHIDLAIKKLSESRLETLASVKGPFRKRQPIIKKINSGVLEPYASDLPDSDIGFYLYNASIYAADRDYFCDTKSYFSNTQVPLVMDRICSMDIDDLLDFELVETLMKMKNISLEETYKDENY
ncbi:acylneuraminate cytidylyltransferase family protein [Alphaproteobacteria bacterium]|nr:acylneuraminate cytidylyltransferase family protein [Alphaproteobacteria bacterium]